MTKCKNCGSYGHSQTGCSYQKNAFMTKTTPKLRDEIEKIILLKPIYTKRGLDKQTSREIEIMHKRDELFSLFQSQLAEFARKVRVEKMIDMEGTYSRATGRSVVYQVPQKDWTKGWNKAVDEQELKIKQALNETNPR